MSGNDVLELLYGFKQLFNNFCINNKNKITNGTHDYLHLKCYIKFKRLVKFVDLANSTHFILRFKHHSFPGRGVDHPSPYRAEVKERVELYLYSTSGPSWPVIG